MVKVAYIGTIGLLLLCPPVAVALADEPGVWVLENRETWRPVGPEYQGTSCRYEGEARDRGSTFSQTCTSSITNVTTVRAAHASWELPADLTRLVPGTAFPVSCVAENSGDTSDAWCEAYVGSAGFITGPVAPPGGSGKYAGVATIPKPAYRDSTPNPLVMSYFLLSGGGGGGAAIKYYMIYRWSPLSKSADPGDSSPVVTPQPETTPPPGEDGARTGSGEPAPVTEPPSPRFPPQSVVILDNMNPDACGLTDTATFSVATTTRIDKIELWFNWPAELLTLNYVLDGAGVATTGTLAKAGCDPYQTSWCAADAYPDVVLKAGTYQVRPALPRICQNPRSRGNGFVRIEGATASN